MFRDPFLQKAWTLRRETTHYPFETILAATVWLEEHYQQAPDGNTAMAIAVQYLLLAMRPELRSRLRVAKEYFSRAVHWQEEAERWPEARNAFTVPSNHH